MTEIVNEVTLSEGELSTQNPAKKEEITLEQLPIHELRKAADERGIVSKTSDKKEDLIKMIRAGETTHKKKDAKRMPHLSSKVTVKAIPMLPSSIMPQLDELAQRGLTWQINEEFGCVTFSRDLKTCANLDQSANNILRTARQAFRGTLSNGVTIEQGNLIQASSLKVTGV